MVLSKIVATVAGIACVVTIADCVPVFLAHPSGAVSLLHAGWRGTAGGILGEGIEHFARHGIPSACVMFLAAIRMPSSFGLFLSFFTRAVMSLNAFLTSAALLMFSTTPPMSDLCRMSALTTLANNIHWTWDRETQALLPLKGKILNVLGAASAKLHDNSEIRDICEALGVQMGTKFNVDDLRYDKIVIMTDADVDGAHIASLLMTFFFTQMRPLIDKGHLYLACPPLYRLTQGARRLYVADDAEKELWLAKGLGGKGKIDVQRFKGLGEMDAKDLKDTTMNPATRKLIRVSIDEDAPGETGDLVERLMGKKPELRFQYIQENARFVEELDV